MRVIKDGIVAFTREGHIISFDSRDEYDHADFKKLNICHIFATPHDICERIKELEAKEEEREIEEEDQ